ncbi:MAG TPA: hypothetical protein VG818_00350 [Gemmatimonadaceae bacterium]|nr:hypothetical protein [Gemmatimonadaceae bacterium]
MWFDIAAVALAGYLCGTWIAAAAVAVLLLIWRIIPRREGPPALQLALTAQWTSATCGMFYSTLTGRELRATISSDWGPMVLLALGSILVIAVGIRLGITLVERNMSDTREGAPEETVTLRTLFAVYVVSIVVTLGIQQVAFAYPAFTQAILALSMIRLAIIYLLLRRFMYPTLRWPLIAALLGFEVALGFTGFFSGFKDPLLLAALAVLERFDVRKPAHWVTTGVLGAALVVMLMMWISVRSEFRADFDDDAFASSRVVRLERMRALSSDWLRDSTDRTLWDTADTLIDRAWAIYYPALAVARVPSVLPFTGGELMHDTLVHLLTPRFLYPDKPDLPSDSDLVRRFTGVYVAGTEEGTSIAFGYVAESYVDFGVPMMFLPMLIFGVFIGATYVWFLHLIVHRELAVTFVTATYWLNLYGYERAWSKMLGFTITMMAYVGGVAVFIDRWLLARREAEAAEHGHHEPIFGTDR